MIKPIFSIGLICCGVVFNACQKVVQLDLRTAPPVYVIEGNITDQPGPYQVQITQTTGFYATNTFPGVDGALVTVSDGAGHSEMLTDNGGGIYSTASLQGVQGQTYSLHVVIGHDSFAAVSTMPYRVNLDSVYIAPVLNGGKTVLAAMPVFVNPNGPGIAYYFFNQTIDGYLDKSLYYWSSKFSAGQVNSFNLERSSQDSTLHAGDTVTVEMQCIDETMFTYWQSLDQAATGAGTNEAGNPVTNLSGGALGYFSAHTSQFKGVRVKVQ
jgi:hypothetical protein